MFTFFVIIGVIFFWCSVAGALFYGIAFLIYAFKKDKNTGYPFPLNKYLN